MHEPLPSAHEPNNLNHAENHTGRQAAGQEDNTSNIIPSTAALPERCTEIHAKVETFLSTPPPNDRIAATQRQTRESLAIIAEALEQYSLQELSFSYNGGKDCLVLLILYLAGLHAATLRANKPISLPPTLRSIYIVPPNPFPAVTDFVQHSSTAYSLSLARSTLPMREAFAAYLAAHTGVRAIFVGTRRTDPHGAELAHFAPTDGGWPAFVRVHPVIDWHYADIWTFIRELGVEYCGLYDLGYTSLGGTTDTLPNPALRRRDGGEGFRPAYELMEDEEERLGREK